MRASHDTMIVYVTDAAASSTRVPRAIRAGMTVQQLLANVLDLGVEDVVVRAAGVETSRARVLLPGEHIEILSPCD